MFSALFATLRVDWYNDLAQQETKLSSTETENEDSALLIYFCFRSSDTPRTVRLSAASAVGRAFLLRITLCCVCLALFSTRANAQRSRAPDPPVTQRHINEMAAALERAYCVVVTDPKLRQRGESLAHYCDRITRPLPGETSARYAARRASYLTALARAEQATAPWRAAPASKDRSSGNRQNWRHAAAALRSLPKSLTKLQQDWRPAAPGPAGATGAGAPGASLAQMITLVRAAWDALRDVRS